MKNKYSNLFILFLLIILFVFKTDYFASKEVFNHVSKNNIENTRFNFSEQYIKKIMKYDPDDPKIAAFLINKAIFYYNTSPQETNNKASNLRKTRTKEYLYTDQLYVHNSSNIKKSQIEFSTIKDLYIKNVEQSINNIYQDNKLERFDRKISDEQDIQQITFEKQQEKNDRINDRLNRVTEEVQKYKTQRLDDFRNIKYPELCEIVFALANFDCTPEMNEESETFYHWPFIIQLTNSYKNSKVSKNLIANFLKGLQNKDPRVRLTCISFLRRLVPRSYMRNDVLKAFLIETNDWIISFVNQKSPTSTSSKTNESLKKIISSYTEYVAYNGRIKKASVYEEFRKLALFCERFYLIDIIKSGNMNVLKNIDIEGFSLLIKPIDNEIKEKLPWNYFKFEAVRSIVGGLFNSSEKIREKCYKKLLILMKYPDIANHQKVFIIEYIMKSKYKLEFLELLGFIKKELITDYSYVKPVKKEKIIIIKKINIANIQLKLIKLKIKNDIKYIEYRLDDFYDKTKNDIDSFSMKHFCDLPDIDGDLKKEYIWSKIENEN